MPPLALILGLCIGFILGCIFTLALLAPALETWAAWRRERRRKASR